MLGATQQDDYFYKRFNIFINLQAPKTRLFLVGFFVVSCSNNFF